MTEPADPSTDTKPQIALDGLLLKVLIVLAVVAIGVSLWRTLQPKKQPDPNNAWLKVWTSQRTGFYYCRQSGFYEKVTPGVVMGQRQALQEGYRPAQGQPCQQPSESEWKVLLEQVQDELPGGSGDPIELGPNPAARMLSQQQR